MLKTRMKIIHITETVAHLKIDRTYSSSKIVKQTNWRQRDIIFPTLWNASCRIAGRMRNRTAIVMMKRPYSWHHVSQKQKVGPLATTRIRFETSLQ